MISESDTIGIEFLKSAFVISRQYRALSDLSKVLGLTLRNKTKVLSGYLLIRASARISISEDERLGRQEKSVLNRSNKQQKNRIGCFIIIFHNKQSTNLKKLSKIHPKSHFK